MRVGYIFLPLLCVMGINASAQNEIITPAGQPLKVGIHGLKLANITSDSTVGPSNGKVLSVDNTGKVFLAPAGSSQWTTNAGTIYYAGSGLTNVGIGTNNPVQKLDVNGNVNIAAGSLMFDNSRLLTVKGSNMFLGTESGLAHQTSVANTFLGIGAGKNSTASGNTFVGSGAGYGATTGGYNVSIGYASGSLLTSGARNVFLGSSAGNEVSTGNSNTFIGNASNNNVSTGSRNTSLGGYSGYYNETGSGNVFIGYRAGFNEMGSNKLYITNSDSLNPLLHGDFLAKILTLNGKIGISTYNFPTTAGGADISAYKLFVKGGILAEEVRVSTGWADYVFDRQYKLKSLSEVARFISKNGHLPNVPSAKEVEAQGIELGTIARIQQEKIEELTLYAIEQEKRLDRQQQIQARQDVLLQAQQLEIANLKKMILEIKKR